MKLKIQFYSFFVSFLFGIFLFLMIKLFSNYIYSSIKFIKIISSFFFVLLVSLLYFLILLNVNYGYIHIYFFLCIILGFEICQVIWKKIVNHK